MNEKNYTKNQENEDVKESFCGACLALPLALAGAGATGIGTNNKKMKNILFWSGITVTVISLIVAIIYLKKCKSCR